MGDLDLKAAPATPRSARHSDGSTARDRAAADDQAARLRALTARADDVLACLKLEAATPEPDEAPPAAAPSPSPAGASAPRIVGNYRGTPIYEQTAGEPSSSARGSSPPAVGATTGRRIIGSYRGTPVYADDGADTGDVAEPSPGHRRWGRRRSR